MKKVILSFFIVLIALLSIEIMVNELATQKMISSSGNIKYLTIRGHDEQQLPSVSLSPSNSDQVDNQTILNSLVSTLVKFGPSGKIEPYLASAWHISENSKVWKFQIRAGFTCESGALITAENFKNGLVDNFNRNLEKSDHTEFSLLAGWRDYLNGTTKSPRGLSFEKNELIFTFDTPPSGLLNFLRMPYFGLWCPENFVENAFRTDGNFSSSGPYRLQAILSKSRLLLKMRTDQPSYNLNAPQTIEIGFGTPSDIKEDDTSTIIKIIAENDSPAPSGFTSIDGPPLIFQGLALRPTSDFFKNSINRKVFSRRVNEFQKLNPKLNFSKGFFLTTNLDKAVLGKWPDKYENRDKLRLKIAFQYVPLTNETKKIWEDLIEYALKGETYEIVYPEFDNPNWVKSILNNDEYALRTVHVYAGARHVVSVIKMMFCTQLGISFPDPSKKICNLVKKYSASNLEADKTFEAYFDKIIVDDSSIFPLFHARDRWLVSKTIDIKTMPTSIIHPLFEKIRLR